MTIGPVGIAGWLLVLLGLLFVGALFLFRWFVIKRRATRKT
jgi:hypothetical protein